jgi:hypothetical protein
LRLVALVRVADQLLLVLREKVVLLVCADAEDVRDVCPVSIVSGPKTWSSSTR